MHGVGWSIKIRWKKYVKKSTEVKNPEDYKRKRQTLLTCIGGTWYPNDVNNPKPPTNIPRLTKRDKKEKEKPKDN